MDALIWPAFSCGSPLPASSFVSADHNNVLELQCCDVPEQWLVGDDLLGKQHDDPDELQQDASANDLLPAPPLAQERRRKRGRDSGPTTAAGSRPMSHVEGERRRRDRLNRRFCDLRAAVPTVSRMDRASLLSDAVAYIAELRRRVEQLEKAEAGAAASQLSSHCPLQEGTALEVRMVVGGNSAALHLTTTATAAMRHAPARLMAVLRELDLPVQHACVCRVGGVTVQDVVVDVPEAGMRGEDRLRAAVLNGLLLQESG
ncbi:unnamed protein product [Urochloa humidicola]